MLSFEPLENKGHEEDMTGKTGLRYSAACRSLITGLRLLDLSHNQSETRGGKFFCVLDDTYIPMCPTGNAVVVTSLLPTYSSSGLVEDGGTR